MLADLNRPVDPATILETFPEVLDVLGELRTRGVRMAVVSDAWPNLPDLHAALGIDDFFEVYAISAVLGGTKPDPRDVPARERRSASESGGVHVRG